MRKNVQPVIYRLLSRGLWYAPHEVNMQLRLQGLHVSPEATTARMRDLRKVEYGRHCLKKRKRQGTDYYEYRIFLPAEQAKAA